MTRSVTSTRSYLYVPADRPEKLEKASKYGPDAIIVDLEDGVSADSKATARDNAKEWISNADPTVNIWVRINADSIDEDLDAVAHGNLTGVILPKASQLLDAEKLSEKLDLLENSREIVLSIKICALIESARGVMNAPEIAKGNRVIKLILGELDLRADLKLPVFADDQMLQFARSRLVYASAAAGIDSPIASVSTDFTDLESYKKSTVDYMNLGFFGRTCIHPNQIRIVNEVFSPSEDQREWARDVLQRLESSGGGATVDAQGGMIDEAVARSARRLLNL